MSEPISLADRLRNVRCAGVEVICDEAADRIVALERELAARIDECNQRAQERAKLKRELAEARKDAARHRWLRDCRGVGSVSRSDFIFARFGDDLDAVIDAEIAAAPEAPK